MATATQRRRTSGSGPGRAAPSETPAPLAAAAGLTFGALSRLRGARIFHPVGVAYTGVLRVERPQLGYPGVPLLEEPGEHPAIFRFSRGAGLPERLPDVLGIAVRLTDVHGPGRHQDFLLATGAGPPGLRHLLLPGLGGFLAQSFSSLLLYRIGGQLRLVGAQPSGRRPARDGGALPQLIRAARRGDLSFRLALASPASRWSAVGDLEVGRRLPHAESEALAFTPWNTGGGIAPTGPFMGIRRAAYRSSQRGRGLRGAQIP